MSSYVPKSFCDRKIEQNSRELKFEKKKKVHELCRKLVGPSYKLVDLRETRQTSAESPYFTSAEIP